MPFLNLYSKHSVSLLVFEAPYCQRLRDFVFEFFFLYYFCFNNIATERTIFFLYELLFSLEKEKGVS